MNAERASVIYPVLLHLQSTSVSLSELILGVLVFGYCNDTTNPLYQDLLTNTDSILSAFRFHDHTADATRNWAHRLMSARYLEDLQNLTRTSPDYGWHFSAMHARPEQIQDFKLEAMAAEVGRAAPEIWSLVCALLRGAPAEDVDISMGDDMPEDLGDGDFEDAALWEMVGDLPGEEGQRPDGTRARIGRTAQRRLHELRESLTEVVSINAVFGLVDRHQSESFTIEGRGDHEHSNASP